jgi:hypothetical protein
MCESDHLYIHVHRAGMTTNNYTTLPIKQHILNDWLSSNHRAGFLQHGLKE